MSNKELQIINDEILTYKQSIDEIQDKINLLKFLDTVDYTLKRTLNLNNDELVNQRKYLEKNLRELLDKKIKMVEENNSCEEPVDAYKSNLNHNFMTNYLSLNNFNYNIDTQENVSIKDSK